MKVQPTKLDGVLVIEPEVFGDARGFFYESFNRRKFAHATGVDIDLVQDNHSKSSQGVLRGLHYQIPQPQAKLVRVIKGRIFDVAVDIRRRSSTLGQWVGVELSDENCKQLWVPVGFAHGFLVLSDSAEVLYKASDYYAPEHEHRIAWNDPEIGIEWPMGPAGISQPQLSAKDSAGGPLSKALLFD